MWLKSGGYIVINQTEALVAIDVNTGKFVGKSNRLEDTIVKTNTEAIKEIVRQIRLRDLGGIIVIDFIDMDERKNRQKVMQALEEAMRADRAPYKILQFNDFGLVAITRKRVKQILERTLCSPCPHCEGAGYIKSVQTVVSEILPEAQKIAKVVEGNDVMLRVHPDVAKVLKSHQEQVSGGARRGARRAGADQERPAAASREVRPDLTRGARCGWRCFWFSPVCRWRRPCASTASSSGSIRSATSSRRTGRRRRARSSRRRWRATPGPRSRWSWSR